MDEKLSMMCDAMTGHGDFVTAAVVSRDPTCQPEDYPRSILLTASRDKTILMWNVTQNQMEPMKPVFRFTGHNGIVNDIAVSKEGKYFASASDDGTVRVWDLLARKTIKVLNHGGIDVTCVSWIEDLMIVAGTREGTVKVWEMTGELVHSFTRIHNGWVRSVKASENKNSPIIVSVGADKRTQVLDVLSQKLLQTYVLDNGEATAIAISYDESICAIGTKSGNVHLIDLVQHSVCVTLDAGSAVTSLHFRPDQHWLSAATEKSIVVWNLIKNVIKIEQIALEVPTSGTKMMQPKPLCVTWTPDSSVMFVGYSDKLIRKFEVQKALFY